jgi:nitrate reductase NapD
MNVCGVLVHAQPDKIDSVEAGLVAIPGVETHGRADRGRIIVTVEDCEELSAADALGQINALPGVVAAALVYQEFDPDNGVGSNIAENKPC